MSEEEVAKRGLPDYLKPGLDIVFIGINPSMFAAYTGKYYDGPGNHFWQALYLSGILSEPMSAVDDHKLLDLGIGFTNIVPRTTRGLSDLSRKEIADGAEVGTYLFKGLPIHSCAPHPLDSMHTITGWTISFGLKESVF